ncbi:uncharacterized protein LOC115310695 [Ixodes scapularis]|uniref:uncharacterized protein LOC115310695 n=1 Tax=Ixodes scapularis TaxID=6945 RepID=UPI001A9F6830|nr:uncharacterized protein LOC115310695 [Ixodes scapularis]
MEEDPQEERRMIHPKKRIHSDACSDSADELDTDQAREPNDDDERQDHEADGNARWSTVNYKKPKPAKGTRIERFDLPKTVIVLKPKEQIRITDISPKLLLDQIRAVLIVPCNRDRLSNVVNPRNNTIAVTVYDERHARDIMQLKALVTDNGRIVEACAYRSVTGTMPRGVIHGMKPETTAQDIVENSDSDYHNIIHARPIGKKGTFLLTFDGEGIPRKISYRTRLINMYTYRPTAVVICLKCHGFGHKAAVCTGQQRYKKCGKTHPEEEQCEDTYCVNCQVSGHTALDGGWLAKKNADTRLQKRAKAPLTQTKKITTPPRTSETVQGRTNGNRFLPLQNVEEFPPLEQLSQGTTGQQTHQQSLQTKGNMMRPHKSHEVNSSNLTEEQLNEMCKELDEIRRRLIEKERRIETTRVQIEKRKQEEERFRHQRLAELEEKRQAEQQRRHEAQQRQEQRQAIPVLSAQQEERAPQ